MNAVRSAVHSCQDLFIHSTIRLWSSGGCVLKDYTNACVVLRNILMYSPLDTQKDLMIFMFPSSSSAPQSAQIRKKGFSFLFVQLHENPFSSRIFFFILSRTFHILWVYKAAAYFSCHKVRHLSHLKCLLSIRIVPSTQNTWILLILDSSAAVPGQVPAVQVIARADRPDFAVSFLALGTCYWSA